MIAKIIYKIVEKPKKIYKEKIVLIFLNKVIKIFINKYNL